MKNLKYFVIWWFSRNYQRIKQIARAVLPRLFTIAIVFSVAALAIIAFGFLIVFSADAKGVYVDGDYLFLSQLAIVPTIILFCAYLRLQWELWQAEQQDTIGFLNQQYRNEK